ncbi:MAG: MSC_0882 family membrane protein [Mycoplasma sp.]
MKDFTNFNNTDELDVNDIVENYESKFGKNSNHDCKVEITDERVWSEPLEESWGFTRKVDPNEKTKQHINLEDELEDTPDSYIKNNQTIRLNKTNSQKEPEVRFEHIEKARKPKLKTIRFEQSSMDFNESKTTELFEDIKAVKGKDGKTANIDDIVAPKEFTKSFATKILFNESETPSEEITKELNAADHVVIDQQKLEKEAKDKEKKQLKAKNKKNKRAAWLLIPKFFRFEMRMTLSVLLLSLFILVLSIGAGTWIAVASFGFNSMSGYWLFMPSISAFISSFALINFGLNFKLMKKELKMSGNKFDKSEPFVSTSKTYKKLITANVNLNWISASIYMLSAIAILTTYLTSYFINLLNHFINDFTLLKIAGTNPTPLYIVWTLVGAIIFTLVYQITFNFLNKMRKNEIELYHKEIIMDADTQIQLRKSVNTRGMICFAFSTLVLGLVALLTYFILKRKKAK